MVRGTERVGCGYTWDVEVDTSPCGSVIGHLNMPLMQEILQLGSIKTLYKQILQIAKLTTTIYRCRFSSILLFHPNNPYYIRIIPVVVVGCNLIAIRTHKKSHSERKKEHAETLGIFPSHPFTSPQKRGVKDNQIIFHNLKREQIRDFEIRTNDTI